MAEPKKAEDSPQRPSPADRVKRRYSAATGPEEPSARRGSATRRVSLTQGLKESGQKVVTAVGALFKDSRGEAIDPEDDPEFVRSQPTWEEDLKKYLPETHDYTRARNASTSSGAGPSTSNRPVTLGFDNVASTSSKPPMVPKEGSGNATVDLLLGVKKPAESLAASRWHKAYQFVKKQNALKKKAMSSPLGTGAKLHGHALGIVPVDDETRRSIFNFWYHSRVEYVLACLIAGHIIVLILKAENKFVTNYIPPKKYLNNADIAFTTLYTVEMLSRIFCLGFWKGPNTYLRNPYNKLDLVIVVDSWVHIARTCILKKDAFCRIAILRVFRILLSFRHFSIIGNILAIVDAIAKSAWQLRTISVFTIMIMSFYTMVGVFFMQGWMQNRCIRDTDGQVSFPEKMCITNENDPLGYLCPSELDQSCMPLGNPNWGVSSFDNYAAGMLVLFQMMTFEGWSLQMYDMDDTSGYTDAYFVIYIVIGSYFIINVYIAAISSIFLRVRHEHQALLKKYRRDKAFTFAAAIHMANLLKDVILQDDKKLTWKQRLSLITSKRVEHLKNTFSRQGTRLKRAFTTAVDWNDPNSYLKRISSFGLSGIDGTLELEEVGQSSRPSFGRSLSRNLSMGGQQAARLGRSFSRNLSMGMIFAAQTTSQKCALVVESKFFVYAVLTIISLNMAGLCTLRANMSHQHRKKLEIMEIGVLILFTAEMVLRFVAAGGIAIFIDERMNVVDVVVTALSFGALGFGPKKLYPNLTPIRMLRWFYKKNIHKEDLGETTPIVVAIIRSFGALVSVFFFLTLVILVFSIIGMELWGGQFYRFAEGYPRANFDTIFQAMLLWFSVTTAESWPDQMWNTMRPGVAYQWMGPILFISYYVISAVVILNLIMAVILEQTELTDNQKKFIQKRDHIKWLQTKHTHHGSNTRSSEWLLGAVVGAQKGYKGMKKRMSTMKVSRMSLFPVFQPETGFVRMMSSPPNAPLTREDVLPRTSPPPLFPAIPETKALARRHSVGSPAVNIPGTIGDSLGEERTRARIFRRSSLSALNSVGLMPQAISGSQMRRRASHDAEKVILRSGFGELKPITQGENRTALQTALLNVVQEQKEFSQILENEKKKQVKLAVAPMQNRPADPKTLKSILGKMPSKKDKEPRVSFTLSDYESIEPEGEKQTPWWMSERSLFFFKKDNRFRIFCNKVVENSWYMYWQYLFIWISLFVIVEQTQIASYQIQPTKPIVMNSLDNVVLAVFSLDFLIKIVAYGFLFAPEAYLADAFNFIDLFNLVVHMCRAKTTKGGYWFNMFWLLAMTRPTRFVVRAPGLRTLSISIIRTLPAIFQMLIFSVVIYAIFAVIGMQLYANRFRSCTDISVEGHLQCVGYFYNSLGVIAPRIWINPPFHFDGFGEAMLALFVLSTFDSWLDNFAYIAMDLAHHHELQPRRNQSPAHIIYFVSFVCIGGFFILRMFVGIFIDQFGIISGTKLLTERQKLWRDTNRIIQSLRPFRLQKHPTGIIRGSCCRLVHSRKFELLIIFVVLVNYAYIASQHYGQSAPAQVFDCVEAMFVSLYLLEALAKLVGTQFEDWWHHKWNLGELVLVLISTFCLFPERAIDNTRRQIGGVFYILRIFRIIRYIPQFSSMISTVIVSLPGMVDIISLMGIVLFLFAGIGSNLFATLRNGTCYGNNITFHSFMTSFVLLFQVTTLDNWSCLISDLSVQPPNCVASGGLYLTDCGLPSGGIIYLVLLVCVTSHIFSNLFVAQIIDCITFGLLDENAMLTPSHLYEYQNLWAQKEFDYYCTGYIGHHKLREFVTRLGPPLGRHLTFRDKWFTRIEYEAFNFRSPKGIPFQALLETLVLYKIGPRGLELPVRIERERQIQALYRTGATIKIQALARGYLQRKGHYQNQRKKKLKVEREGEHKSPQSQP